MSSTTAASRRRAGFAGLAKLIRARVREPSDRIYADASALAPGWTITGAPGPPGSGGRVCRDLRFSALRGGDPAVTAAKDRLARIADLHAAQGDGRLRYRDASAQPEAR